MEWSEDWSRWDLVDKTKGLYVVQAFHSTGNGYTRRYGVFHRRGVGDDYAKLSVSNSIESAKKFAENDFKRRKGRS